MRADRLGIALLLAALAVPPVVGDDRTATVGWPDNGEEASPVADHPVADKAKHEAEHDTSDEHEDEDEDEDEDEPNITPVNLSVTLLGILTFLIAVTVIFEEAKERIVHSASDRMRPVVDTLFSEMTVLGFLSLVTFSVSKLGVLPSLSTSIFGDGKHNEEYLEELLEMVHYALFLVSRVPCRCRRGVATVTTPPGAPHPPAPRPTNLHPQVMVIFVSVVLLMVAGAGALEVKWNDWNKMASEGDAALKQHILRLMSRPNRRVSIAIELAEFTALRKECIDAREVLPPFACRAASHSSNIPEDFNFGQYLSYALAHFLTETGTFSPSPRPPAHSSHPATPPQSRSRPPRGPACGCSSRSSTARAFSSTRRGRGCACCGSCSGTRCSPPRPASRRKFTTSATASPTPRTYETSCP